MSEFADSLRQGVHAMGLDLEPVAFQRLVTHQSLLTKWMRRINLTAITEPRDMVDRLYLDCLVVCAHLQGADRLHDVGSGAGFPGLVIKAVMPHIQVTLTEARHKRVSFLKQAAREMGLDQGLDIRWQRIGWEREQEDQAAAEKGGREGSPDGDPDSGRHMGWPEVISRATFPPKEWLRRGTTLLLPKGRIWVMAGHALEGESQAVQQEASEWNSLLEELGLERAGEWPYRLPFCGLERRLLAFRKSCAIHGNT